MVYFIITFIHLCKYFIYLTYMDVLKEIDTNLKDNKCSQGNFLNCDSALYLCITD